jgi:hypothetical protein
VQFCSAKARTFFDCWLQSIWFCEYVASFLSPLECRSGNSGLKNRCFESGPTEKKSGFVLHARIAEMSGQRLSSAFSQVEPLILKMLHSRHYGPPATLIQGEDWSKIYGPYLLYVNSGASNAALWADAKARAANVRHPCTAAMLVDANLSRLLL